MQRGTPEGIQDKAHMSAVLTWHTSTRTFSTVRQCDPKPSETEATCCPCRRKQRLREVSIVLLLRSLPLYKQLGSGPQNLKRQRPIRSYFDVPLGLFCLCSAMPWCGESGKLCWHLHGRTRPGTAGVLFPDHSRNTSWPISIWLVLPRRNVPVW